MTVFKNYFIQVLFKSYNFSNNFDYIFEVASAGLAQAFYPHSNRCYGVMLDDMTLDNGTVLLLDDHHNGYAY